MAEPKVVYKPWDGATPESELSALVLAYRYLIFGCHETEKGASPGAPDAAKEKGRAPTPGQIKPPTH